MLDICFYFPNRYYRWHITDVEYAKLLQSIAAYHNAVTIQVTTLNGHYTCNWWINLGQMESHTVARVDGFDLEPALMAELEPVVN